MFAAIDIIRTVTGGALQLAFRLLCRVLGNANVSVLDFTSRLGDAVVKFRDFLNNNTLVKGAIDLLTKGVEKLGDLIGKAIDKLANTIIKSNDKEYIYYFARDVQNAPIDKLAEAICQTGDTNFMFLFARDVKNAPIDKLATVIAKNIKNNKPLTDDILFTKPKMKLNKKIK